MWDVAGEKKPIELGPLHPALARPDSNPPPPIFSADNETVATLDARSEGNRHVALIRLWDSKGKLQSTIDTGVPDDVSFQLGMFSPDGKVLAGSYLGWKRRRDDKMVRLTLLWSVPDRKRLRASWPDVLVGDPRAFSADGKRLSTSDGVYDVASGKRVSDNFAFPYLQDSTLAWVGSSDVRKGVRHPGVLTGYEGGLIVFSRDGKELVNFNLINYEGVYRCTVWNLATGEKREVAGKATASPDGKTVKFENGTTLELYAQEPDPAHAIAPDDWAERRSKPVVSPNRMVWVKWGRDSEELASKQLTIVEGNAGPHGTYGRGLTAAFSPDGKYLALGFGGAVLLWDISPTR